MENNRFDKFAGNEVIFMYIAMDTYAQASYKSWLEEDGDTLTKEHQDRIDSAKNLISEIIEFGQQQGNIPKKK